MNNTGTKFTEIIDTVIVRDGKTFVKSIVSNFIATSMKMRAYTATITNT
jgi:uncharacterized Rmd1/YagE family protein